MAWVQTNASTTVTKQTSTSTNVTCNFSGDFTATAGRLLVFAATVDKSSGGSTPGSGWTGETALDSDNTDVSCFIHWKKAAGGETSVTATIGTARTYRCAVFEYSLTDDNPTFDGGQDNFDTDTNAACSTGTATSLSSAETQAGFAVWGRDSAANDSTNSISNSFSEVISDYTSDSNIPDFCFAENLSFSGTTGESTLTTNGSGDQRVGMIAVFYEGAAAGGQDFIFPNYYYQKLMAGGL